MIKFFRKIRQKLVSENKISKYLIYAIGEIILVVIGILIALQINNWNEYKKERAKERVVLEDIINNLNRNNELIRNSLVTIKKIDNSSDVIISVIRNKKPYSDTLGSHFFESTRSGGLLFPLSTEGYESLKNAGFDIIRSGLLKDEILELFEISYTRIKEKSQWATERGIGFDNYVFTIFNGAQPNILVPLDYNKLLNDARYISLVVDMKAQRSWYMEDILDCLSQSEELIQTIKEELKKSD